MTKRFVIFQKVIKCVRTASAIEEFLPVVEMSRVITQLERRHLIGVGFLITCNSNHTRHLLANLFMARRSVHWAIVPPIPVCLPRRSRQLRRLPLSAVHRHLLDVFSAPTHPFLVCFCLGVVFDSIIMSNSCIHHLSKLSINKYLQSDVFLFHSLIAGDIKYFMTQFS